MCEGPRRDHTSTFLTMAEDAATAARLEKEAFVSGLEGSTVVGSLIPVLILPFLVHIASILHTLAAVHRHRTSGHSPIRAHASPQGDVAALPTHFRGSEEKNNILRDPIDADPRGGGQHGRAVGVRVVGELLCITVPELLCLTADPSASWRPLGVFLAAVGLSLGLEMYMKHVYLRGDPDTARILHTARTHALFEPRKAFVTNFRACTTLLTCLCILAVDFRCFHRGYAKTEARGTALMDLGSGMFIFGSAIVSPLAMRHTHEATSKPASEGVMMGSAGKAKLKPWARQVLKYGVPVCLGVLRLVVLRALDYQQHDSEYGVHWNFYVTLAAVWFAVSVMHATSSATGLPRLTMACVVLAAHQAVLSRTSLSEWMLSAPRTGGFFAENREGIASVAAFAALYLVAEAVAEILLWQPTPPSQKRALGRWMKRVGTLGAVAVGAWVVYLVTAVGLQPTSRRTTNLAYTLWLLATALTVLGLFAGLQVMSLFPQRSLSLDAINAWPLTTFLVANLLTGAVNLWLDTLRTPTVTAVVVLVAYMLLTVSVPVVLSPAKRLGPNTVSGLLEDAQRRKQEKHGGAGSSQRGSAQWRYKDLAKGKVPVSLRHRQRRSGGGDVSGGRPPPGVEVVGAGGGGGGGGMG